MELITIFMGLSAVISASFAIWLNKIRSEVDRQFITYNISIMEGFALVMCIGAVIGMSLAIWSYTKAGQKWIDEL